MSFELIRYEVADGILTLTLNRPDKMNAWSVPMRLEMMRAIDMADADDAVHAIVVTGAGKAFCAGADLSGGGSSFDMAKHAQSEGVAGSPIRPDGSIDWSHEATRDGGGKWVLRLYGCLKPLIGAINGAAVGMGATMLLPMDVRLASTEAKFAFPFVRRGIVPDGCSSWFLPRLVGISQSLEWMLSGRIIPAAEAKEAGLVKTLYAPDELLPAAYALARQLTEASAPVSVAYTRQLLWRMLGADHPFEAHRFESRGIFARGRHADTKEGVTSFLEKRPPDFPGKVSTDMPECFPWWQERKYE